MININDSFERIFLRILDICSNPNLLEVEYDNEGGFWVGYIYLEDNEEADDYDFTWNIGKPFRLQSEETQQTIKLIIG